MTGVPPASQAKGFTYLRLRR